MIFHRAFPLVLGATLIFGLIYRLAPLVFGPDAMARFFITEDGYLMLTVARNLALGNGLSVSDGTIATNGVQPLATFLYAIPYWITGGDKVASLVGVIAIMSAWSLGALVAIQKFARAVLAPRGETGIWSWLVAALWFVGPLMLLHSMNALETGLYVGIVALTVGYFARITARSGLYTRSEQVIFGCLCGITFLARIDGAILVTALFAVRFVQMTLFRQASLRDAVVEAIPPGLLSLAFAAPWLIHNQIFFGSIMPISGTSQSMAAGLGSNLAYLPAKLFESMFPMLPVPTGIERDLPVVVFCLVGLFGILAWSLWRITRNRHPYLVAIWGYVLYGVLLVGYYGLFFGAPHFLSRYFAPLSPLLISLAVWALLDISARLPRLRGVGAARIGGTAALALSMVLLVRLALPGMKDQGHFQVVSWVGENVAEETWVGAIQTGTLGYWHDRTINLDGKVNPQALLAREREGNVLDYVVASDIKVVADWVGIAAWIDMGNAAFTEAFDVVVVDADSNLAVLRRVADTDIPAGSS